MNPIPFDNQYIKLGDDFYVMTEPSPTKKPELIKFNNHLATELGLNNVELSPEDCAAIFSGNRIPAGAEPLAMAYAGHQFGSFNPQLGDGRAILLGELVSHSGIHLDMQLKGSGRTHYSRGGDGRAALGPVLREYLLSEAMAKLGVPTTRALAAVTTGEDVVREQMLPGAVITRIATSFVRVGTFQYFAANENIEAIKKLADHVIKRNFPEASQAENPYAALLAMIMDRQAALIAQWMQLGFIHGVMNTDNMSVAGETIDYGPCAFMDAYDHDQVYSSIDRGKRYAYSNQPSIGLWNLTRLAESLLPLLDEDTDTAVEIAKEILETYAASYQDYWLAGMRRKIGLLPEQETDKDNDRALLENLFDIMASNKADFTLTFYYLSQLDSASTGQDHVVSALFNDPGQFDSWVVEWRKRLSKSTVDHADRQADMCSVNPVYIPRNHQVEAAIRAAEDHGDFSVFHELHELLQNPYELQEGKQSFMLPPKPDEVVQQTFCGT